MFLLLLQILLRLNYLVFLSRDSVVCNSSRVGGSKWLDIFLIGFLTIGLLFFKTTFLKSEAFIFGILLVDLSGNIPGGGGGGGFGIPLGSILLDFDDLLSRLEALEKKINEL